MKVKMNKTKVIISGEWQNVKQKVSMVEVLVIIQYMVLVVRSKYTRNVVSWPK